ncbi:mitochondrial 37S ribosomal protein rsm10 [Exophiala xenobiotica]|nr:mitochondrial 37S ribosomal protein rsm10 [Exophiala xenobiotica]KAK5397021.1 mitochondrial 37S ribosomal protein rsm10 [Exophiala xenobiotica]KAK5410571.1 mitochondrial 37S ribosomal protein rsm10 [Exophiala xenobiotica]KAK5470900.1 mitochondrial 37S ribosomal protein rsm10 [Exophiala xenobiotica]KAK5478420.1 mitochondrial 37S ribosomal protein rsm10 [Exophiala xenobiotica]
MEWLCTKASANTPLIQSSTIRVQPRILPPRRRDFSSSVPRCLPEDITAGFPMPEIGSHKLDIDEQSPQAESQSQSRPQKQELSQQPTPIVPGATHTLKEQVPSHKQAARASRSSTSLPLPQELVVNESLPSAASSSETTLPPVPPNVLAAYRTPLRHAPTHGIPVAQLQLHSYSVRNLQFYADFCVRAAFYLGLPCSGPGPLPRKTERWTVLKSNFVNKKAQENFERITMKRLITIYDGEASVVETWLAFIRKWQFYGVGIKANVWQWEELDVAGKMDKDFKSLEQDLDDKLHLFGFNKSVAEKSNLLNIMDRQKHRHVGMGMSEIREKSRTTDDPF